ncbi:MAG: hypothetical protein RLZZ501_1394 [Pseudomonadota bacterium]|jgi:hypothetical protein
MPHDNRGRISVDPAGDWRLYCPVPPRGAEMLGTVTRASGETGALARTAAGVYVQVNGAVVRTVDQRKVATCLDGRSVGRPTADGAAGMARKNVTLDAATIDAAREIGGGDLSLGLRRAVALAMRRNDAS